MLAKRIIPTLLFRGDTLVKGKQFRSWRSVGSVVQAAKIYGNRGADEIILLDIGATPEGRGPNLKIVEKIANDFFTPLTVGGGVRSIDDVRDLLNAGADKVAIGTAQCEGNITRKAAMKFGSQAIVGSVDVMDGTAWTECGRRDTLFHFDMAVQSFFQDGAGEILLTSIDREGMMQGYDLDLIREVSEAVTVPVIAHGGCGSAEHCEEAIAAGASAVAIGSLFQFTDETPASVARYLANKNIEVRL